MGECRFKENKQKREKIKQRGYNTYKSILYGNFLTGFIIYIISIVCLYVFFRWINPQNQYPSTSIYNLVILIALVISRIIYSYLYYLEAKRRNRVMIGSISLVVFDVLLDGITVLLAMVILKANYNLLFITVLIMMSARFVEDILTEGYKDGFTNEELNEKSKAMKEYTKELIEEIFVAGGIVIQFILSLKEEIVKYMPIALIGKPVNIIKRIGFNDYFIPIFTTFGLIIICIISSIILLNKKEMS